MLTLYYAPGASSMAPHIALHEIGVPFEAKSLSLAKKQQREPAYMAINPEGRVPTLVADGLVLTEVAAILYYLARKYPAAKLWPEGDLGTEAQVVSWMSFIAATLHPARARGAEHARAMYALADQRLGSREWATGAFTIADIHLFRLYWRFKDFLKPEPGEFASLEAHRTRMMQRPSVKRTIENEASVGYELPA